MKWRLSPLCARQGAPTKRCDDKTSSPLQTRQGELLATGKGVHREVESEGSRSKALARRTETTYEAAMVDKGGILPEVQYLYSNHGRICGGYKCESGAHYPGRSGCLPPRLFLS